MSQPKTPYVTRAAVEGSARTLATSLRTALDAALTAGGVDPAQWGFTLFLFNYGQTEKGQMTYISTANRDDMVKMIREWLAYQEGGDPGTILPPPGQQN